MPNIETIELDEKTVGNLRNFSAVKQKHIDAIEQIDQIAQAVINTILNVKGLEGQWSLTADMKLVKAPEFKVGHPLAKPEVTDAE